LRANFGSCQAPRLESHAAHDCRSPILQTSPELPEGRTARANKLLGDAVVPADYLLTVEPAAVLGAMGARRPPSAAASILSASRPCGRRRPGAGRAAWVAILKPQNDRRTGLGTAVRLWSDPRCVVEPHVIVRERRPSSRYLSELLPLVSELW
jgi:hypothetical protein